ncbi:MAG: SPOR domain-containing protein [Pseudoruegeria sp.]
MAVIGMGEAPAESSGLSAENLSKAVKIAGAGMSVALLIGVGIWGYRLALRDVTGVPTIHAADGPMRVQPEDPGGRLASHLGLSVNAVQAQGEAGELDDELKLAPVAVNVIETDIVGLQDRPDGVARDDIHHSAEAGEVTSHDGVAAAPEALKTAADNVPAIESTADILALANKSTSTKAIEEPTPPKVAALKIISTDIPGVVRSQIPKARPAGLTASDTYKELDSEEGSSDGVIEVRSEALPSGTSLVQLGAFQSPEIAREEWERLAQNLDDYLDPKQRVIERAERGGSVFYRLRVAGFDDISDARRFCSALRSEGADCIPVVLH